MAGEWRAYRLGDLVELYDGPHATPPKTSAGPIFLGISNLAAGRLDLSNTEHVSDADFLAWTRRVTPRTNDLVFSYETRLGEAALIPAGLRCCLGRRMGLLRLKTELVDPRFLLYAYLGDQFQTTLRQRTVSGSTVDRLPLAEMPDFKIDIPAISTQRGIADVLGSLDDKIELNRRTSETLEAIARALFKSWFVDFEPARAKSEGRDPGLPKRLADLFPDSLYESALGQMPRGWRVGILGEAADNPRRSIQPNKIQASMPYIGLEHMPRRSIALSEWDLSGSLESNKFEFRQGELLFGQLRPYFHKVGVAPVNGVCSTDILVVMPKDPGWFGFVMGLISSDKFIDYATSGSTGTKMPRTSWQEMAKYQIPIPPKLLVDRFSAVVDPLIQRILVNVHHSRALIVLRDTLLPKLLSGELRIKNAERIVGAHT